MGPLCHPCQAMLGLNDAENVDRDYGQGRAFLNFKDWSGNAVSDSCHLCTLLFYAAAGPDHQNFIDSYTAPTYELWDFSLRGVRRGLFFDPNEKGVKFLGLIEKLKSNSEKVQRCKQLEESIRASTMTQETIQQVIHWMDLCSKRHDNCQQYQTSTGAGTGLPLRLIDVDPNGQYLNGNERQKLPFDLLSCENATNVCVKLSNEAIARSPNGIKYLTLSHRWGDTSPTELNWDNMAELSAQIPISSLSKTFKDAVHITRCLGFQYIWIDSICINQADDSEKASEISRMQNIYKHSQLNLSATSGQSGLIFPRNPKSVLPVLQKSPKSDVRTTETDEDCLMVSAGPWETYVDLGPLNERAWVVQERLLAPRVLHCCYNMVYWECPCLRSSEVDPLGEMDHRRVTNRVDFQANIKSEFATASVARDAAQTHDTSSQMSRFNPFHLIVRSYFFPNQLTYPNDRLPAISGVAKWFMTLLNLRPESYLAGLWQETLPECLLWHFFKPAKGGAVRDPQGGPSWSWASVLANDAIILGVIEFNLNNPRPLFQNFQATIVPRNGDRFGQLKIAILRLQVSIIPVEREWRNDAPRMAFPGANKWYPESQDPWSAKPITRREKIRGMLLEVIEYLGSRLSNKNLEDLAASFEKNTTTSYIQVRWDTTDMIWTEKASYRRRQLYMIPIAWDCDEESIKKAGPWTSVLRGLILRRLSGQGQYERVGMFMTAGYFKGQNPELSKDILRRMPEQALASFSIKSFKESPSLWQRVFQAVFDLFRPYVGEQGSDTTQSRVHQDDHLGISDNGLHNIEIL